MTGDREALWRCEDHVRAREAQIGADMRERLALLEALPPALRAEFEQTFIVNSAYLGALHTDMDSSAQQATILRQRVRQVHPARSAPTALAPRTAPRRRGTGTRPAAERAAGPRSGNDPGDDGPSHPPAPLPDAPRADGSHQEGRAGDASVCPARTGKATVWVVGRPDRYVGTVILAGHSVTLDGHVRVGCSSRGPVQRTWPICRVREIRWESS